LTRKKGLGGTSALQVKGFPTEGGKRELKRANNKGGGRMSSNTLDKGVGWIGKVRPEGKGKSF